MGDAAGRYAAMKATSRAVHCIVCIAKQVQALWFVLPEAAQLV
jgi:hypothetical protein